MSQPVFVVVDPNAEALGVGFSNSEIRRNFIKKVYGILSVQLAITLAIGIILISVESTKQYFAERPYYALIASLVAMIPLLVLSCCPTTTKQYPLNFFLLGVFVCNEFLVIYELSDFFIPFSQTLLEGFSVAAISCAFKTQVVILALAATAFSVIVITLLSAYTSFDITNCGCLLIVLTLIHMVALFVLILLASIFNYDISTAHLVLSVIGAFLFMLWLAYDTQLIIGGKHQEISPEEYIYAAITLYIDIIQIFLYMLQILSAGDRR